MENGRESGRFSLRGTVGLAGHAGGAARAGRSGAVRPSAGRRCEKSSWRTADASLEVRKRVSEVVVAVGERREKFAHFGRCGAAKGAPAKKIFARRGRRPRYPERPPCVRAWSPSAPRARAAARTIQLKRSSFFLSAATRVAVGGAFGVRGRVPPHLPERYRADGRPKNIFAGVLTVKKTVIRFRPKQTLLPQRVSRIDIKVTSKRHASTLEPTTVDMGLLPSAKSTTSFHRAPVSASTRVFLYPPRRSRRSGGIRGRGPAADFGFTGHSTP